MNKINYISLIICAVLIHLSAVAQLRYTPEIEAQASQGDKDALRSLGYCYQTDSANITDALKLADERMYEDKAEYYKEHPEFKR